MKKSSTEMLIKAGLLPKEAIQQLENHKLVPAGTSETVGSSPVSLETDSAAAEKFADRLQETMDVEDGEIRLSDAGQEFRTCTVEVHRVGGRVDPKFQGEVDVMGRVYLPPSTMKGQKYKIKGVALNGGRVQTIIRMEPRYRGSSIVKICCSLEK